MDNNNPAEMSNEDLEKDMQEKRQNESKSTAAEGTLKTPVQDESSKIQRDTVYKVDEEQDLDDLVHTKAAAAEDSQDGSIPDPEEVGNWENNEMDADKISS